MGQDCNMGHDCTRQPNYPLHLTSNYIIISAPARPGPGGLGGRRLSSQALPSPSAHLRPFLKIDKPRPDVSVK
eukprot:scaffold138891_cov28-Tisochrysis_lutea.AAC.1